MEAARERGRESEGGRGREGGREGERGREGESEGGRPTKSAGFASRVTPQSLYRTPVARILASQRST
jgi:hypothetical protein